MKLLRILLITALALIFMGAARPTIQTMPVGSITALDREGISVSVDLGADDLVMKGMSFSVVDDSGKQLAVVMAGEVFADRFWSARLEPQRFAVLKPGYAVRWILTPEVSSMVKAIRANTLDGYRSYIERFPDGAYMPELLARIPKDMLQTLNPEYYAAVQSGRKEDIKAFAEKFKGTGYARAAMNELAVIERYDVEQEKIRQDRQKRAQEAEAEEARRRDVDMKIKQNRDRQQMKELLGKFKNNYFRAVRFVFEDPSIPAVTVEAYSSADARLVQGSYKYKVYEVDSQSGSAVPQPQTVTPAQPAFADPLNQASVQPDPFAATEGGGGLPSGTLDAAPLKEATADIMMDFWEIEYP